MFSIEESRIGIIGLGYVGLPLAVEFGKQFDTLGFDIDPVRINDLRGGVDRTMETTAKDLAEADRLTFTEDPKALRACNVFVVTVPTPIDRHKQPDLEPLRRASEAVAEVIDHGNVVIFESTVYPGATEEICVPIIEAQSGLTYNEDFFIGYSPERINPGDKEHRLPTIRKVTSGSTPEAGLFIDSLYRRIISAGTHLAPSIKVAEAAKVIENTQRDVNIALVNELALIFDRLGIDTLDVLEAAGTKWNFLPFRPGLVGGHCIGVDPYYLTHKAQAVGYHPEVILSGRRLNDGMGSYAALQTVKGLLKRRIQVDGARVLILGLAFKENCPDLRNTRVVDVIFELQGFGVEVDVHDPWVDREQAMLQYGLSMTDTPESGLYDAILLAVPHELFVKGGAGKIRAFGKPSHIFYDLKSVFPKDDSDMRL
ncbi:MULTISPECIES: Vi polysaccharide biosynthesis UDP-N-acetylglucosamine C-6 dehydrogenase TviB [unclassified Sulfitobacter]|nr:MULTISPECIES: Vi polysaccharide biosynthesis UDP-N-acetylglucosamine C-6 dehydrogenase TviB [unclassified Sulfitobacter]KZY06137.1 Vi polysaccharide biosynthesis protein VipA/TviB [Sulfitobacter sp. HI0023]KZY24785.1 Vi polysaccharide biosynthesis protein VipA/TviB [Sulfitobacter sp. HI0040]KZZ66458.1 Vi polysaccharide biosynthesis protein VipA/TviB [Sulfitobacter sp. HI0129]